MALREKRCTACCTLFLLETPHQRLCPRCRTQCRVEGCALTPHAQGWCRRHLAAGLPAWPPRAGGSAGSA